MARTQHLRIYTAAYGLVREIYRIRLKLPKNLKHDLGRDIIKSAIKILKRIVEANRTHDKGPYINLLLLEIEVQWALLRVLNDLRGISEGEYKALSERLIDIGKQAEAWFRWEQDRKTKGLPAKKTLGDEVKKK